MAKEVVCDICNQVGRYCQYTYRKSPWRWLEYNFDSQGGWNYKMDVCDVCMKEIMSKRRKETTPSHERED